MRAFSILFVLAAHALPLGPNSWALNLTSGVMGMSLFFCLSGFLITTFLWDSQDIGDFLVRRIARIVPLVLLFTTIFCLIFLWRPDSFIATNLYVLNYTDSAFNPTIGPLWSLGVEMHFYLGIALAVALFGRRGFWLVAPVALAVLAFRIEAGAHATIRTHLRVDEILSGCMLALAWLNRDHPRLAAIWRVLPRALLPLTLLWLLACAPQVPVLTYIRPYIAAALVGALMVQGEGRITRFLSTRLLAYIAAISFALYVWHSPFLGYWFNSGTDVERYLLKRPLSFLCIWALAHASTFYFEKPMNALIRRLANLRKSRAYEV